jgi:hypothetical protein
MLHTPPGDQPSLLFLSFDLVCHPPCERWSFKNLFKMKGKIYRNLSKVESTNIFLLKYTNSKCSLNFGLDSLNLSDKQTTNKQHTSITVTIVCMGALFLYHATYFNPQTIGQRAITCYLCHLLMFFEWGCVGLWEGGEELLVFYNQASKFMFWQNL